MSRLAENPQPAAVAKPSAGRGTSTPHPRDSQMDATIESNGRASSGGHGSHIRSRTSLSLLENFDRPIAFHRCFVTLTGSVTAALMLSQAMYWQKRTKDPEGWWCKTVEEWTEETGMTRIGTGKRPETAAGAGPAGGGIARRAGPTLVSAGRGTASGHSGQRWAEIRPHTGGQGGGCPVGGKPANWMAENQPTSWREIDRQVGCFSAIRSL